MQNRLRYFLTRRRDAGNFLEVVFELPSEQPSVKDEQVNFTVHTRLYPACKGGGDARCPSRFSAVFVRNKG